MSSSLDNWNPMAEDYESKQFNSYNATNINSEQQEFDLYSLYIKNVPADLTENAYRGILSEFGAIRRMRLMAPTPDSTHTVGLCTFETEEGAAAAMQQLNNKPPTNFKISYARAKNNAGSRDVNRNNSRNNRPSNQSVSRTLGRGRCQPDETEKVCALKVTLDGDKRIAYNSNEIPELIPNPNFHCLACKKPGELSCSVCKKPYCSQSCQAEDWRNHKSVCGPTAERKESGDVSRNYKSDVGYNSAGSNSDSDKRTANGQPNDPSKNRLQNLLGRGRGMAIALEANSAPHRAAPGSSQQDCKGSNIEPTRQPLTNIKINDIGRTALPLDRDEKVYVSNFQNPAKLWMHLKSAKQVLSDIESQLKNVADKSAVASCSVNDVCFTLQDGVYRRIQIKEVKGNAIKAYFIDYGNTCTLTKGVIYHLPPMFKKYSSQAVSCKLVNGDGGANVKWNDEDFVSFQEYTKGKEFKMKIYGCYNDLYDVSLVNEEGVSLYVIAKTFVEDMKPNVLPVPSVWANLKEGSKVTVKAMDFDKEQFWGVLDDGLAQLDKCLTHIDELMKTVPKDTEVVNMSCEEGDLVIALSAEFQTYFRCVVLKRLRNSFLVRYIDYGNTEEVTELRSTTPALLQKQSYVVCCVKPKQMPFETFQRVFSDSVTLSVKSVNNSFAELSFECESRPMVLQCFPWDHGISSAPSKPIASQENGRNTIQSNPEHSQSSVKSNHNKLSKLMKRANPASLKKAQDNISNAPVMKGSIPEKKLVVGKKYDVTVTIYKNPSELYVQFIEDGQKYASLSTQINQHCSADSSPKYRPVIDEVICCVYHEDNKWYRAQVLEKLADNKFKVIFTDFGNEEIIPEDKIKALPQKLAQEKLSACVSLLNVKREDIAGNLLNKLLSEVWSMEVKEVSTPVKVVLFHDNKSLLQFRESTFHKSGLKLQKLPSNVVSEVTVCYEDAKNEKKLYLQQTKDIEAIVDILQKINSDGNQVLSSKPENGHVYCCRSALDNMYYRACVRSEVSPNTYLVQFIDFGNEENVSYENFKEISEELYQRPVYCIPVIVETKPVPVETDKNYSVQVIDDTSRIQTVKFLNMPENSQKNVLLSSLEKLTLKTGLNEVQCVHTENGIYYCQILPNSCGDMSEKLQKAELEPLSKTPEVNSVVCAKSNDSFWYRASIDSISKDTCKVFFIDFGNSEVIPVKDIKSLPEEFCKYPIFSIPVRIKNATEVKMDVTKPVQLQADGFASDGSQFAEIVSSKSSDLPNVSSLKSQSLPSEGAVEVSFCYMENDVYYTQVTSSTQIIESLGVELKNAATFDCLVNLPKEKYVVCVKSSDQNWYRGTIKNVSTDQKNCQVYFIDYGNSETVAFTDLKMLPAKLCDIPILAIPVKLLNPAELEKLLLANISVFKIKVVAKFSDSMPMVEIVTGNDVVEVSIEPQALPEALTEVVVSYKEGEVCYVQKNSDVERLLQVMNDLQTDKSIKPISSPEVEQFVCVKFSDGVLYRGLIKEKTGNDVKAFFVDYGNTAKVSEIFNLPSQYSLPMFSIPVIISNETTLASPLAVDSVCKVKYSGQMKGKIQIVRVCPPFEPVLLITLKTSVLEKGSFDVLFHGFDGQFYFVSKASDFQQMKEVDSKLANFCGDQIYHVPSVNEILLVKIQGKWQRGCVKKSHEATKNCEIYLVDLGSTETIPFSHLYCMPKNIVSYPIFVNKVILSSADSLSEPIKFEKPYTVTVIEHSNDVPIIKVLQPVMFTSIERKYLPLNETSKVIFYHKENDVLFLQAAKHVPLIAEVLADVIKCASTEVISHNPIVGELLCAQSDCDGGWYRCCIEEVVGNDKYRIHFIDYGNCEVVSKANLRYLPKALAMYPSFGIAVKLINQAPVTLEQVYDVVAVSEPVNNLQSVELVLEEKVDVPAAEVPKTNEVKEIASDEQFLYTLSEKVTIRPGEQEIAIYNVEDEAMLFCTPFIPEDIAACHNLMTEITNYCNSLNCSTYNGDSLPVEDEMVFAKFADDNQWYRAVVLENRYPIFDVVFTDFGNSAEVQKDSLRKMKKEFMSLPMQAVLCSLKGFKAISEDMTSITTELKKFTIFEKPEPLKAIVTICDEDEINMEIPIITKHLVEKGLVSADKL